MKISRPVLLGGVLVIAALALAYVLMSDRDPGETARAPVPLTKDSGTPGSAAPSGTDRSDTGTGAKTTAPPAAGTAPAPDTGARESRTAATDSTDAGPTAVAGTPVPPGSGNGGTQTRTADTESADAAPAGGASAGTSTGAGSADAPRSGPDRGSATATGTPAPPRSGNGGTQTRTADSADAAPASGASAGTAADAGAGTDTLAAAPGGGTAGQDTAGQDSRVAALPGSRTPADAAADRPAPPAARSIPADDGSGSVALPVVRQPPAVPLPVPRSAARPAASPGPATAGAGTPSPGGAAGAAPETAAPAAPAGGTRALAARTDRNGTAQAPAAPASRPSAGSSPAEAAAPATRAERDGTARTPGAPASRPSAGPSKAGTSPAGAPASQPSAGTSAAPAPAGERDEDPGPEIDIVRVDPRGNAAIAGRARPGAEIEVGDGTTIIGSTRANEEGEWVIVPEPLAPGDTILTLRQTDRDGAVSESPDAIIIGITPPAADGTASSPLAAVVPRAGDPALSRPTRVIQVPQAASGDPQDRDVQRYREADGSTGAPSPVTVDTVDYDEDGNVVLGGRAEPDATVQVYVDNRLSGTGKANDTGEWVHRSPQPISPGTHELRIDQVTESGAVVHRVVLPFVRAVPFRSLPGQRVVIIQPGNNLWTIAYRVYGTGTRYTTIYQANADQIRDPDLIYPGQVFGLPKAEL